MPKRNLSAAIDAYVELRRAQFRLWTKRAEEAPTFALASHCKVKAAAFRDTLYPPVRGRYPQ